MAIDYNEYLNSMYRKKSLTGVYGPGYEREVNAYLTPMFASQRAEEMQAANIADQRRRTDLFNRATDYEIKMGRRSAYTDMASTGIQAGLAGNYLYKQFFPKKTTGGIGPSGFDFSTSYANSPYASFTTPRGWYPNQASSGPVPASGAASFPGGEPGSAFVPGIGVSDLSSVGPTSLSPWTSVNMNAITSAPGYTPPTIQPSTGTSFPIDQSLVGAGGGGDVAAGTGAGAGAGGATTGLLSPASGSVAASVSGQYGALAGGVTTAAAGMGGAIAGDVLGKMVHNWMGIHEGTARAVGQDVGIFGAVTAVTMNPIIGAFAVGVKELISHLF